MLSITFENCLSWPEVNFQRARAIMQFTREHTLDKLHRAPQSTGVAGASFRRTNCSYNPRSWVRFREENQLCVVLISARWVLALLPSLIAGDPTAGRWAFLDFGPLCSGIGSELHDRRGE